MRTSFFKKIVSVGLLGLMGCLDPHSPEPAPQPEIETEQVVSQSGLRLFNINTGQQVCNESITQDVENYPASMLWLGFGGRLNVKVPEKWVEAYGSTTAAIQHDRLTISDTSNTVKWFLHKDEANIRSQMQDPEWTTHPDYLVFLGSDGEDLWSPYVVRLSDKEVISLGSKNLEETSSPHLWLDTAGRNQDTAWTIEQNHKMAFNKKVNGRQTLFWKQNQDGETIQVSKPAGKENFRADNPMISPDGNWLVFNLYEKQTEISTYLLPLVKDKAPLLLAEGAADARWWTNSKGELHLVYAEIEGDYFIKSSFTAEAETTGELGRTILQEISLGNPEGPQYQWVNFGKQQVLANLPFKGGLSPDGFFLATGYADAQLGRLP